MGVVSPNAVLSIAGENARDGWVAQWTSVGQGPNTGQPLGSPIPGQSIVGLGQIAGHADRSVQVAGTFGAGCTLTFQGTNDGVNWSTLTTPSGQPNALGTPSAAVFTTGTGGGMMALTEACIAYRWSLTGGDNTTSLVINMFARKTQTP